MTDLYVEYSEHTLDFWHDGEQYGEWSEQKSFEVKRVTLTKPKGYDYESLGTPLEAKAGDTVWVLWMIYSSGDTFGNSTGNGEVLWTFKNESAGKAAYKLLNGNDNYTIDFKDDIGNDVHFSNPSAGYFENQEAIYLEAFVVEV